MKGKNPALPPNPNKTKINNLPDKKYKALVIRKLTDLGKRTDEHKKDFNKELENLKRTRQN